MSVDAANFNVLLFFGFTGGRTGGFKYNAGAYHVFPLALKVRNRNCT